MFPRWIEAGSSRHERSPRGADLQLSCLGLSSLQPNRLHIFIFICIHIFIYTYIFIYINIKICMYVCTYLNISVPVSVSLHTFLSQRGCRANSERISRPRIRKSRPFWLQFKPFCRPNPCRSEADLQLDPLGLSCLLPNCLSIRCIRGDIRLWVGDPSSRRVERLFDIFLSCVPINCSSVAVERIWNE